MLALGINKQGYREVLGFGVYAKESAETWTEFLKGLKGRGLEGLLMIIWMFPGSGADFILRGTFPAKHLKNIRQA